MERSAKKLSPGEDAYEKQIEPSPKSLESSVPLLGHQRCSRARDSRSNPDHRWRLHSRWRQEFSSPAPSPADWPDRCSLGSNHDAAISPASLMSIFDNPVRHKLSTIANRPRANTHWSPRPPTSDG